MAVPLIQTMLSILLTAFFAGDGVSANSFGDVVPRTTSFYHPPSPPVVTGIRGPQMHIPDVALALRWTGEMNRRLQAVTAARQPLVEADDDMRQHRAAAAHADPLRGGGQSAAPFRVQNNAHATSPPLTVFHAKQPRAHKSGAARWGPSLETFLTKLQALVAETTFSTADDANIDNSDLELALAMIYLDRACSVETPRSSGLPPCPFCTPRTVHRLAVTAVLVAMESTRGGSATERLYPVLATALGIPQEQLRQMVDWMLGSLGDVGFFVDPLTMQDFTKTWERRFGCTVVAAEEETDYFSVEEPNSLPAQHNMAPPTYHEQHPRIHA